MPTLRGSHPGDGLPRPRIRPFPDAGQIAGQFFSDGERAALSSLPEASRAEGFFNCWTRKEAYVKGTGEGLSRPLHRFDVSLAPGEPARLLRVGDAPAEVLRWCLEAFSPAPGWVAALAAEGSGWALNGWDWK
ncbi:MAG: 4'-phosphopantetheinyl transferase superfamily protein [Acetobacteraceae bacterium]|nr:4'-phosphopantetheinyl transferase superfamily protein [Acetobacteraceae bacterium]